MGSVTGRKCVQPLKFEAEVRRTRLTLLVAVERSRTGLDGQSKLSEGHALRLYCCHYSVRCFKLSSQLSALPRESAFGYPCTSSVLTTTIQYDSSCDQTVSSTFPSPKPKYAQQLLANCIPYNSKQGTLAEVAETLLTLLAVVAGDTHHFTRGAYGIRPREQLHEYPWKQVG